MLALLPRFANRPVMRGATASDLHPFPYSPLTVIRGTLHGLYHNMLCHLSKNHTSNRGGAIWPNRKKSLDRACHAGSRRSEVGRSVPDRRKSPACHLPGLAYESHHQQTPAIVSCKATRRSRTHGPSYFGP